VVKSALLFLVAGIGDTFRINGRAIVTDDMELLSGSAVAGRVPAVGIVVSVEEALGPVSRGAHPLAAVGSRSVRGALDAAESR
jgi:predicted pyridoxine 5'-phosphate oxidase superfamily flavin-nucleotide-binding protein